MKKPKISIITVVYNAADTLEETIISVLQQKNYSIEYVIIDGHSNDGSLNIIHKYDCPIMKWVSEPDSGIYDAMNKAIDRSSGEWIYFLGADDRLEPNVISNVVEHLSNSYVMVYGDVVSNNGRYVKSFLNLRTFLQNTIHHQGAFYNRMLFENFRYDITLKILSDYELNLKIYLNSLPVKHLPMIIACCHDGGASSNMDKSLEETNIVRSRLLGTGLCNKALSLMLGIYYAQKRLRKKF